MPEDPRHPAQDLSADASAGGADAPPPPRARNRAPHVTREYHTERITVQWFAERCIHSAECIQALPQVFNPRRRPWVDVTAADADAIAAAILLCPTGALHFIRHDGAAQDEPASEPTIRVTPDGPLYLQGDIEVKTQDGELIRRDNRIALCRCGQSRNMPFCDNSHRGSGFRDAAKVRTEVL